MHDISAIALFCFDARQEKGGTETLVGVYPDNVNMPGFPGGFVQLTVYLRIHMSTSCRPAQIIMRVVLPDGNELNRHEIEQTLLEQTRQKAVGSGNSYVGMITRFTAAPVRIEKPGRIQAIVNVDGTDIVAGSLNCRLLAPAA